MPSPTRSTAALFRKKSPSNSPRPAPRFQPGVRIVPAFLRSGQCCGALGPRRPVLNGARLPDCREKPGEPSRRMWRSPPAHPVRQGERGERAQRPGQAGRNSFGGGQHPAGPASPSPSPAGRPHIEDGHITRVPRARPLSDRADGVHVRGHRCPAHPIPPATDLMESETPMTSTLPVLVVGATGSPAPSGPTLTPRRRRRQTFGAASRTGGQVNAGRESVSSASAKRRSRGVWSHC